MTDSIPNPLPADTSNASALLAILWITLAPAIIIVPLRLYTHVLLHRRIDWSDSLIVIALALSIYGAVLNHLQVKNGFGRHVYYLSEHQIAQALKWSTLVEIQNEIGVFFVKTSICLFILEMISRTNRAIKYAIWFTIVVFFIITAVAVITISVQCTPFQSIWDKTLPSHCISKDTVTKVTRAYGVLSVVTDFTTASLPIFVLQGLQMNTRTKFALCLIMGLGFFTAATSIGKTVTTNFVSMDFTRDLVDVEIWSILEEQLGMIVASVPALRQLFVWSRKPNGSRSTRSNTSALTHPNVRSAPAKPITATDSNTSEENLVPMNNMHVRKTTELRVNIANGQVNTRDINEGNGW